MDISIDKRYTFDNFIVKRNNELAYKASLAAALSPGNFSPLFIVGGRGSGKTHLLCAIKNHISENTPLKVQYFSVKDFPKYPKAIIKLDVLLLDEIQLLAVKRIFQRNLLYVFNMLYSSQRQIIMAGTQYPQEIPNLDKFLMSRFGWGLIVHIKSPKDDVKTDRKYSTEDIQEVVAHFFNIGVLELVSRNKHKDIAYPRHIAMYLCRKLMNLSFSRIAKDFARKDHTTVLSAVNKIEERLPKNKKLRAMLEDIETLIKIVH